MANMSKHRFHSTPKDNCPTISVPQVQHEKLTDTHTWDTECCGGNTTKIFINRFQRQRYGSRLQLEQVHSPHNHQASSELYQNPCEFLPSFKQSESGYKDRTRTWSLVPSCQAVLGTMHWQHPASAGRERASAARWSLCPVLVCEVTWILKPSLLNLHPHFTNKGSGFCCLYKLHRYSISHWFIHRKPSSNAEIHNCSQKREWH